jgi:A/G-specific adenine glycosylase
MKAHADSAQVEAISLEMTLAIQCSLLAFFDAHQRTLPWRASNDPYRVLVSEIMLQQTRVDTIIPYYDRWLAQFPDFDTLATAAPDRVLRAWEGLGYYSRARNLHRTAMLVRERHAGGLPRSSVELRQLPGIGAYTAGAVASICFGESVPAVDGNARRVFCRLLGASLAPAALTQVAHALIPAHRPGDFNQAVMELGATICTPRAPRCAACPVRAHCRAAAAGTQELLPVRQPRTPLPEFRFLALVLHAPDGILLTRTRHGLLADMWRFPTVSWQSDVAAAARSAIRRLTGRRVARVQSHELVSHTFSHRREHYHPVSARLNKPATARMDDEWRWADMAEIETLALPRAQRRILEIVLGN